MSFFVFLLDNKSAGVKQFASSSNNNNQKENDTIANNNNNNKRNDWNNLLRVTIATSIVSLSTLSSPNVNVANAFEESDYASETVTAVVKRLDETAGNVDQTFSTFEEVAAIITEGKGVGGSISYTGVKLDRGYVSDEDTSIYNPGLTLLTESEKERLTSAIIHSRQTGLSTNQWSENNEFAYDFLKQKLDPLHMAELKGYLGILPYWGAVVYLGALGVQQVAREAFVVGYAVAAALVFGPIFALIAKGP
eukprot:CAMPEP_0185732198 /NCGR_PEP_ID=MMETSP1171-20130828/15332_1 /TAXON_ID=374046 /ORGANISM="Helicotheca tamensis, Strain CCMP826" /LENGTH=249 /DNA_ID=CAMNT_0028401625 /DNA_START=157 /DNA_END=907 /DNA_ORIENTATION=-